MRPSASRLALPRSVRQRVSWQIHLLYRYTGSSTRYGTDSRSKNANQESFHLRVGHGALLLLRPDANSSYYRAIGVWYHYFHFEGA
jgi:hypothetical protein